MGERRLESGLVIQSMGTTQEKGRACARFRNTWIRSERRINYMCSGALRTWIRSYSGGGKNVRLYLVGMFFRATPGDSCRAAETAVSVSGIALPPFHPGVVLHTGLGPAAATCYCSCEICLLLSRCPSRASLLSYQFSYAKTAPTGSRTVDPGMQRRLSSCDYPLSDVRITVRFMLAAVELIAKRAHADAQ
jgi:hypothetical protein